MVTLPPPHRGGGLGRGSKNIYMMRLLTIMLLSLVFCGKVSAQNDKSNYILLEASRQMSQGNLSAAHDLYDYAMRLNPQSGTARFYLSTINRYMRNDSVALREMEEAVKLYPDNYWYKDMLVKFYFNAGKKAEAQAVLEDMATTFPDKSDVLMMLIDLYASNEDYENMVKALDKLEVKEGKSEQLSMEKFRLYVRLKDEKSAFKEMRALADEYPNDLRYQVLIGDLYLDQDTEDGKAKALAQYKMVEAKDSTNVNALISLSNYYQKEGNDSLCQHYILKMVTNPKLDRKVRLQLVGGLVYENLQPGGDSIKMLNLFDKILAMPQEDATMHELCARYMASSNMSKERLKPVLKQMLEIEPESEIARNQLLAYAVEENDSASIYSLCKPAVEYGASEPMYYFYLGLVYYQQSKYDAAIETFKKGVVHTDSKTNLDLTVRLHSLIGDLYHQTGYPEKAFQEYDSCLIYRYDDAYVLNNYSYYLSLIKKDLDRAEKMSKRSNELEKDNPTYLDTYAWILFVKKDYNGAKETIEKALEIMGEKLGEGDTTIIEHAGDIYSRCGEQDNAMKYWLKAKELGGSDNPKALDKKIKKRKL